MSAPAHSERRAETVNAGSKCYRRFALPYPDPYPQHEVSLRYEGTMISHVVQQGDCNAGATYQSLMNHIFAPYIGVFMHVYLDDIVIF